MKDVLEIRWIDSETIQGWTSANEIPTDTLECVSVGILAHDAPDMIVLAISFDHSNDSFNPMISIPKVAIKSKRRICKIKTK